MYFILICCIVVDQLLKYLVIDNLYTGESIALISDFFYLTYVKNDGAAWNILSGNRLILIFVGIVVLFFVLKYALKRSKFEKVIYAILCGGIIGNLCDRVFRGYVVDYLDFKIFGYSFPVFNFADTCIVISCILLVFWEIYNGRKNKSS